MELIDREPILQKWMRVYESLQRTNLANMDGAEYATIIAQINMLAECIMDLRKAEIVGEKIVFIELCDAPWPTEEEINEDPAGHKDPPGATGDSFVSTQEGGTIMTDNEIIKALKCYSKEDCDNCPASKFGSCINIAMEEAIALINRQKAEIERLIGDVFTYKLRWAKATAKLDTAKAEAIKEFAERLNEIEQFRSRVESDNYELSVTMREIDNLVKEMVGAETVDEATAAKAWERANVGADNAE